MQWEPLKDATKEGRKQIQDNLKMHAMAGPTPPRFRLTSLYPHSAFHPAHTPKHAAIRLSMQSLEGQNNDF